MESLLQDVLCKLDTLSYKLDTISERMYVVENKMSYFEKQLYLRKLHEQTTSTSNQPQYAPRSQQIPQYIAPISRRPQPPILNPYFKPQRHKKHVTELRASTPHTKNNATSCQQTHPSSQPDAPAQPSVQPAQPSLPISPAQPSSHRAQLTQPQTTELSQTIGKASTSTDTNSQRTPMSNQNSNPAQKSPLHSMSPIIRSKRTRYSSTDSEHYIISPVFQPRLKNRKILTSPVNDIDSYEDIVPHIDNDFSDWK